MRGTYILDRDAPIPGVPWTTFWFVIANSPTKCPIISGLISIATYSFPECNCSVKPSISGMTIMSLTCDLTGAGLPPFSFRDCRTCSISIRCSLVRPLRSDLRCLEGRSLMNSSIDICFSSSTECPRYVNCLGVANHSRCFALEFQVHDKNVPDRAIALSGVWPVPSDALQYCQPFFQAECRARQS